jgi:hypothetical protein
MIDFPKGGILHPSHARCLEAELRGGSVIGIAKERIKSMQLVSAGLVGSGAIVQ